MISGNPPAAETAMIAGQGWPTRNVAGALATALIYGAVRG
jgi:hypothetical protein